MGDAYEVMEMTRQKSWREIADELRRENARLRRDARICAQSVLSEYEALDGVSDEMTWRDVYRREQMEPAVEAARQILEASA